MFGISSEVIVTGMKSNLALVESLKSAKVLRSEHTIKAFTKIDRKDFVPSDLKHYAYLDQPLPIGRGQTISQPYTVAFMMELLQPQKGDKVLDIGFGSGWTIALLAAIVGGEGRVYGFEIEKSVFKFGAENLEKSGKRGFPSRERGTLSGSTQKLGNITLFNKSGWNGFAEHAPYDRILVSAVAGEVPKDLKKQLRVGGRLVIPVGKSATYISEKFKIDRQKEIDFSQAIVVLEKISEGKFKEEVYPGFAFVPLVKK